jgi:hypothetical protein
VVWRICVSSLLLAMTVPAFAWGPLGHKMIGAMAEEQLSPGVRERALGILAKDPIDDGPHLADVANWADAVRGSHDPRYTDSYRWHWIRFNGACHFDAAKQCAGGQCVNAAIDRFAARLGDQSLTPSQRAEALRFLVHFVGDVHQPMHAGYRNDRNGFDVPLQYKGEAWSLHGVWDYVLLDSHGKGADDYASELMRTPLPPPGRLEAVDWAEESCRLATEGKVYPETEALSESWVVMHRDLAEQRVRLAAARLAALIERALKP